MHAGRHPLYRDRYQHTKQRLKPQTAPRAWAGSTGTRGLAYAWSRHTRQTNSAAATDWAA